MPSYQPSVDLKLGRVSVWGPKASVPPMVRECIPGRATLSVHDSEKDWPKRADFYIVKTLTADTEWEAARLFALPVCLPAAAEWLTERIASRCQKGETTWIVLRRRG
jgi:hypothetical protein